MYLVLSVFLAVDVVIMTSWSLINPFYRDVEYFPRHMSTDVTDVRDIEFLPHLEHCHSQNLFIWYGTYTSIPAIRWPLFWSRTSSIILIGLWWFLCNCYPEQNYLTEMQKRRIMYIKRIRGSVSYLSCFFRVFQPCVFGHKFSNAAFLRLNFLRRIFSVLNFMWRIF